MDLQPFLIHGPGSHSDLIEGYLDRTFAAWKSFNYWPKFVAKEKANGGTTLHHNRGFDLATYFAYAVNNRLAKYNHGRQLHKRILNMYYDYLCSNFLRHPSLLIAWSQVSLHTISKNKKLGGKTMLEHPMTHVDYWMNANKMFYDHSGFVIKPGYNRFSNRMRIRMLKEYEMADKIQVHSTFARNTFLHAGVDESKMLTCKLGINKNYFPDIHSVKKPRDKFTVLYVGRLELLKGVHTLLEAVKTIPHDKVDVILVGRVLPEIEPFLHGVSSNIKVVGPKNRQELSAFYRNADVLVFPSLNDAFGMVILEAMLHQLPVIASTASAGPDIIRDSHNGFIVNAGDRDSLIEKLNWCMANRDSLSTTGLRAQETILQEYLLSHYEGRLDTNLKAI